MRACGSPADTAGTPQQPVFALQWRGHGPVRIFATQRDAADLAQQSFRLTTLRYRAGEATALGVVDAQNALATALNAFADGQARYRESLATLQTITGPF